MPLSAREQLSDNRRKFDIDGDLGLNVCVWNQGITPGFLVKVPGKDWKYFTNPSITYDERREEAKKYRDLLLAGGDEKPRRNKKNQLPYDLPDYVYYKSTQDGFNVNKNGHNKNFVTKNELHKNLFKAMNFYLTITDADIDDVNWMNAYTIIEDLKIEFGFK
jgi:hypothetical protein